jgi:serine/threonine protein kinase
VFIFIQTDIWSLGCCAYEMATTKVPYDAKHLESLRRKKSEGHVSFILSLTFTLQKRNVFNELANLSVWIKPFNMEINVLTDLWTMQTMRRSDHEKIVWILKIKCICIVHQSALIYMYLNPLLHEHFVKNGCFHWKVSRYKFKLL